MNTTTWVKEWIESLPPDAVRVCPGCQGAPLADTCRRCNGLGKVSARLPKQPKNLCGLCGAYVSLAQRQAEICNTCHGPLPPWSMEYR
jgi:hypothetical protein